MQRINHKMLKDKMYYGETLILSYTINYPCFNTTCCSTSAQDINNFYYIDARQREKYCRTTLYSQALEIAKDVKDRPFFNYEYSNDFKVTYNYGCITSLFMDTYTFTGGAHGNTNRTSKTWDFNTGTGSLLQLGDVISLTPLSIIQLQKCIEIQITERLKDNPGTYFDDYEFLLKDYFCSDNFYLKQYNFVIYYQHYDISPYYVGIPEFFIPITNKC